MYYVLDYTPTYFFRLSFIPIVVSPIIIPIGFISGFAGGVPDLKLKLSFHAIT